jgi:integrase
VFGATRTSVNASITPWLDRYIELTGVQDGGFLFPARDTPLEAVAPSTWTERVKAMFARHGDVALCPKEARSSFITFLRSGDHDDEAVQAAAIAMRHSSKTQASAAYDKGASDRRVAAAMKVAADYSAKFTSGASSSTDPV